MNRQCDGKNCKCSFLRFNTYFATMRFDGILAQTQAKACSLPRWFSGQELLKDFIEYFLGNTVAVVFYTYQNFAPIP